MMRTGSLAALLLCLAASAAAQAKPDFSGEWVLDKAQSRLHPQMAAGLERGTVQIAHREPLFRFHRTFVEGGQEDTLTWELKTDGQDVKRTDGQQSRTQRLSWAGDTLVFLTRIVAPRGEATNLVRYTLEDSGRRLRAEESFRSPRITYDNVWVFVKR